MAVDLELTLHRRDAGVYGIDLRFSDPASEADKRLSSSASVRFDDDALRQHNLDPEAYGALLAGDLLGDNGVRAFLGEALAAAQAADVPLSLRLAIGANAGELHSLRWETLRLPQSDAPLLTGEHLRFSRYLSSLDWRPVRLRPQAELRALVVVADPANPATWGVAEIDAAKEVAAARAGLGEIPVTELATRGEVTLANLAAHLRDGYDIVYLVAHGALADGEPHILLEEADGSGTWTPGRELVTRIYELQERPRLVVLVSCQSAGSGDEPTTQDDGVLAALGPRLAEAGVPAVIAMQGNLTMQTAAEFMPVFFSELRRDGQVDRAMSVARGAVRERPDWWMPVLFMRLRSGRIGYKPGFGDEREGLRKWPALLRNIEAGRCTPIVGPGASEWLLGSRREIAARWAADFGYPMDPNGNESLPQVAQYLAVDQDVMFMRDELDRQIIGEVVRRYGEWLPPALAAASPDELVSAAAALAQSQAGMAIFHTLARLPLPIYVTTNPGNLLSNALREVEVTVNGQHRCKEPVVEVCRWNDSLATLPSIFEEDRDYRPSVERPLVFHLFGRLDEPESLVVTEDDFFDYLIGVTSNNDLIPIVVRNALVNSALLFLGFGLDDWDFRVLFRSIINRQGSRRRNNYAHVAAQIDPEAGRIQEPEGARRYLETYFDKEADISIFWGGVADFTAELAKRLKLGLDGTS
ncbi:MAG: CHAT domain-containing protein [Caldilinea sp.]|nr:CHAT domain-containing protein [Caldilineaceae bacterium]MCO5211854.1 CHAT domain-containing protein [Caldilinea sp.]MCW5845125.1 CHAT domain-containing protein [Caldilinea sp.]